MITNLYVCQLDPSTTAEALSECFSRYGVVSRARIVIDKETGLSRGFGYVEMEEGADRAVSGLNGSFLDGSNLAVSVAKPRVDRSFQRRGFEGKPHLPKPT